MKLKQLNRRRLTLVIGLLVAAASGSCTSSTAQPTSPAARLTPASARPSAPRSSISDAKAAVDSAIVAYRNMWQAYVAAIKVPNPNDPALSRYATGSALSILKKGVASAKQQGLKGTGNVTNSPFITQLTPVSAPSAIKIRDCMNTAKSHLVRSGPGPVYHDTPGGRRLCNADIQRQPDGTWKVTAFGLQSVGTC